MDTKASRWKIDEELGIYMVSKYLPQKHLLTPKENGKGEHSNLTMQKAGEHCSHSRDQSEHHQKWNVLTSVSLFFCYFYMNFISLMCFSKDSLDIHIYMFVHSYKHIHTHRHFHSFLYLWVTLIFLTFFIVVQVQLSPFSLHHCPPPQPSPPPTPHPIPPWFCPCVLYRYSWKPFPFFSHYLLAPPLWLLSVYS